MRVYSGAVGTVWAVARLAERGQIAALADHSLVVWDEGAADPVQTLPLTDLVRTHSGLSVSSGGEWLAGHYEGHLHVWRWSGKGWQAHSEEEVAGLFAACFARDSSALATARVADDGRGGVEFQVARRSPSARKSALSALSSRQPTYRFDAHPSGLFSAASLYGGHWWAGDLSADARWVVLSARDKAIHVWDVEAGKHAGSVKLRGTPNEAALSPDGSLFAVDGGTTVYVHRTQTAELVAAWRVKHCYVPQLAWSPDGRWLARADLTSAVHLFNVAARHEATPLGVRGQRGKAVAFSADGSTYLVGTVKGSVVVWDMDD